jgi:hypothetical protein
MQRVETEWAFVRQLAESPILFCLITSIRRHVGAAHCSPKRPDIPFIFVSGTIGERASSQWDRARRTTC